MYEPYFPPLGKTCREDHISLSLAVIPTNQNITVSLHTMILIVPLYVHTVLLYCGTHTPLYCIVYIDTQKTDALIKLTLSRKLFSGYASACTLQPHGTSKRNPISKKEIERRDMYCPSAAGPG